MKPCTVFNSVALGSVLFCGSLFAAQNPPPADLIIYDAKVVTVNSNFTIAQAIAIRGNKIVGIGRNRQMEDFKGFETRMIDAQGHIILPGLYDNLVDSYHASVSEPNGPTPVFDSMDEVREFIRTEIARKPAGSWVVVERAWPTRMRDGHLMTKAELDDIAPKNPVYWNCGDLGVLNSKALEVLKITGPATNMPGGEVVVENITHKPTGLLRHAAKVVKLAPPPATTVEQHRAALKHLYELYNQQGITSIGEAQAGTEAIDLFRDMEASNELTVRITCTRYAAPGANIDEATTNLDALTNTPAGKLPYAPTGVGDDWVRIGPLLVKVDGSLLDSTAYLRTPYGIGPTFQITEPTYRGQLQSDPDFLTAYFTAAAQRGWQVTAECSGDAGLDQLVNCLEKVEFKTDISQKRFLIRNGSFQAAQDWDRCKQLGLGAEMQPMTFYRDGSGLLKMLGEPRLKYFMAFQRWYDHGITIGAGSGHEANLDSLNSCNPWNPWLGIWTVLTRQTAQNDGIYIKDEQLSREEAIQFYTINNARLHFEEHKKGSLEVGKLADLIMLDQDILKCPVDDIRNTRVKLTIVDGKVVWDDKHADEISSASTTDNLASLPIKK
ncbi:MAG TPA: amidohydrolase [Verrucomicrobiae bacterium]|nr:amidohydrolase [Verrucomicrobiae bacterium]